MNNPPQDEDRFMVSETLEGIVDVGVIDAPKQLSFILASVTIDSKGGGGVLVVGSLEKILTYFYTGDHFMYTPPAPAIMLKQTKIEMRLSIDDALDTQAFVHANECTVSNVVLNYGTKISVVLNQVCELTDVNLHDLDHVTAMCTLDLHVSQRQL